MEPHGVLLLSRLPMRGLTLCHLPSQKDRKFVLSELETADGSLCAGSVHLESSPPNILLRLQQLDRALPWLSDANFGRRRPAILPGISRRERPRAASGRSSARPRL
jgi:endonuclease/exonuclease/phosphatase family metal-dependent hydrolase